MLNPEQLDAARQTLAQAGNASHTSIKFQNDILGLIADNQDKGDVIIEIGCYRGGLTAQIAMLAKQLGKQVHVVDISPEYLEIAKSAVRSVVDDSHVHYHCQDFSIFVREAGRSLKPLLVFVDGDHRYEGVARDVRSLHAMDNLPYAAAFHDFSLRYTVPELADVRVDKAILDTLGHDVPYTPIGEIAGTGTTLTTKAGADGHYHETGFPEGIAILCSPERAPRG